MLSTFTSPTIPLTLVRMPYILEALPDPEWVRYGIEGAVFFVGMTILIVLYFMIKKSNEAFQSSMVKWRKNQEESLADRQARQDERAKQQDDKLTKALEAILKGQSHVHTRVEENVSSKFTNFVHSGLERLVQEIKCNRAYFVIYHNGAWSTNGISLPKMSLINEAYHDYGLEPIMPQLQSIPRGFLPGLDTIFEEEGHVFYRDITPFKTKDPITYSWLAAHGTKAVALFPVRDVAKDYNIGFIAVEYYSDIPEGITDKAIKIYTSKVAEGIAAAACFTDEDEKLASGLKNQHWTGGGLN